MDYIIIINDIVLFGLYLQKKPRKKMRGFFTKRKKNYSFTNFVVRIFPLTSEN